jgi:hypothetical protein
MSRVKRQDLAYANRCTGGERLNRGIEVLDLGGDTLDVDLLHSDFWF